MSIDPPTTPLDPRFQTRERQAGLDLLRALALLLVIVYHAGIFGFALPGDLHRFGLVGVDLFFVLSGYLIGAPLLATLARGRSLDYRRFYLRRALRILPAYLVVVAIYFIWPGRREFPNISPLWKFLLSVQNIDLRVGTAFSHAWSLAVEDQFYLLLPPVLALLTRWPRRSFFAPGLVLAGGLALRAFLAWHLRLVDSPAPVFVKWVYYPTWTRLDPLILGVAAAATERYRAAWWDWLMDAARWLWLPGLAALTVALWLYDRDISVADCVWRFPLTAFGMATLLLCALSPRLPFRQLRVPGAAFLASVAYSVYLASKLVIHLARELCASWHLPLTSGWALLLAYGLILALGSGLFFAVERPFLLLRHRVPGERGA